MSLFPAYAVAEETEHETSVAGNNWLANSSFPSAIPSKTVPLSISSSSSEDDAIEKRKKERKKHRKKIKTKQEEVILHLPDNENSLFFLDKTRELSYQNMIQPPKGSRPRIQRPNMVFPDVLTVKKSLREKKKPIRYFSKKFAKNAASLETNEEELKGVVEELNKAVYEEPRQIENWLKLVAFQDDYLRFQQIKFKTSLERDRAIINQKLTILTKAMAANPGNEALQELWLELAFEGCPADEVESKILELMKTQGEKLALSLHIIQLSQLSMPRCKSSSVLNLYKEAMDRMQRAKTLSSRKQDQFTLELLFHACIFLQQSGLWEMAWKTVKLVLNLNLSLDLPDCGADEQIVIHKENELIKLYNASGTPVWNVWSSLECLRQGHHFLPVESSNDFPQRVVSTEEVVGLVYHVRRDSHFRLLFLLPMLSKVPVFPSSHSMLSAINSHLTPWVFDGVEWKLASILSQSPLLTISGKYLSSHLPAILPPQYLHNLEGQSEFLALAENSFDIILKTTAGRHRTASAVWYFRFLRWLDRLRVLGRFQTPKTRPKVKNLFKQFLKKDENRDNMLLYVEYALWEFESGAASSSINILQTLANSKGAVLDQADEAVKSDLCSLYRTLCEVQISSKDLEGAKSTLRRLCATSNDLSTIMKLKHVAIESVLGEVKEEIEDQLLPNFTVDWISCYAMFLSLVGKVDDAMSYLEGVIKDTSSSYLRERLWEIKLGIYKTFATNKMQLIISTGIELLKEYPYNHFVAAFICEYLVSATGLWWKELSQIISLPSNICVISVVCAVKEREKLLNISDHRSRSILKRFAAKGNKTSILIHRMMLATLHGIQDLEGIEAARILSLEAFPWCKDLYLDAVSSSPSQLMELTDLLVEKDLRIHITPDEIEAMRD